MPKPFVAVLMGSDSDLPVMQGTLDVLKTLEIPFEIRIGKLVSTSEVSTITTATIPIRRRCGRK